MNDKKLSSAEKKIWKKNSEWIALDKFQSTNVNEVAT